MTTENDSVYRLSAVTGAIRWQRSLGAPLLFQGQWGYPAAFADTATVTTANAAAANDYAYYVGSGEYLRCRSCLDLGRA